MKKRIYDILLIVIPLVLCGGYLLCRSLFTPKGDFVTVEVDGQTAYTFPLNEDREVLLGEEDGGYNILVISSGEAYVKTASCPDKVCVNTGKISAVGERIVCLPNKTAIRITSETQTDAPDLVP